MLTFATLPLRSAGFHWRANVPVLLGVAVGAAVLTGALLVGDSLRGSLRDRADRQLNGVDHAYVGTRFVRQEVAANLPGTTPALILQSAVRAGENRVGRATVIGLTPDGFARFDLPAADSGVVLSARVAGRLGVVPGGSVDLGVEKFSAVPRSSFLGRKGIDDVTASLRLPVAAVLRAGHPMNDFNLTPNPAAPLNVFVPLELLQTRLDKPGRVNALLATGGTAVDLSARLAGGLALEDWGLRAAVGAARKAYLSVESESLVLDPAAVAAVERAAGAFSAPAEPTIAYLANALTPDRDPLPNADAGAGRKLIPYSVVAALNPAAAPPLGPFLPAGVSALADTDIVLADWPASPLRDLPAGSPVSVHYFKPEVEAGTEEAAATFTLKGTVPLAGVAADPDLTPKFPGITDKRSLSDWNSPFDLNNKRIQRRDEDYWKQYRATPKAYITRAAGEKLFGSRYGVVTSVRVAPPAGTAVEAFRDPFAARLLSELDPAAAGFVFQPVRGQLLAASRGSGIDFGVLFLLFSGLLIGAALLLVGLLFRLTVERRAREVGVLLASGYSPGQVLRILLAEGLAVAAAGALAGLVLAVGYAAGMLAVLTRLWPDAEVGNYLTLHVTPLSCALGFGLTLAVAAGTILLSLRGIRRVPPPALLRGVTAVTPPGTVERRPPVLSIGVAVVLFLVGGSSLLLGGRATNPDYRAGAFFGGGLALLIGGLLLGRGLLIRLDTPGGGLVRLGGRNAGRSLGRSLLTTTLIAVAAFLVVSVESFRRRPDADFRTRSGGSGGFALVAEADVPLFQPFDRGQGRDDVTERLRKVFQQEEARNPAGASRADLLARAEADLAGVSAIPLRLQGGDDASCLNLYQAGRPRVLGVPDALIERGAFRFGDTTATTPEERANPWLLLTTPQPDGRVPAVVEQNTAMFMLKTGVGGEVTLYDEAGRPVPARIVGLLQDSVFQSEMLVADAQFRRLYPRQDGYRVFLIDAPPGREVAAANRLESALEANGLVVTPTADKVAAYQQVVGAYLSTFQLLGALALLLAVLGLGVVVLRNVWERGSEFALLRAVGYRAAALRTMTLAETGLVLGLGLGVGVGAAVLSVLPNAALGGSVPWGPVAGLLAASLATGAGVAGVAVAQVTGLPVVPALRRE